MTWCAKKRVALWNLVAASALLNVGCPSLNWGSGPSEDPFFSVADPVPVTTMAARTSKDPSDDGFVPFDLTSDDQSAENGELPDRSRPER